MGADWLSVVVLRKKRTSLTPPDNAVELRASLREMLECPVCYELLRPPVLQCLNGHSLCGNCTARLSNNPCPICRGRMEGSRNLVAEELCHKIWYPCKYKRCQRTFMLRDLESHEASCDYRLYCCPLITSWRTDGTVRPCSWALSRCEVLSHAHSQHSNQLWRGKKHHVIDYNFTSPFQRLYLISTYDELFLWCGKYVSSEQKFYGALKFEGPMDKAIQFKYTFKLSKCLGRETLKITCTTDVRHFEDIFSSETCCVILDIETIKRFSDGDKVSFFLKIEKQPEKKQGTE